MTHSNKGKAQPVLTTAQLAAALRTKFKTDPESAVFEATSTFSQFGKLMGDNLQRMNRDNAFVCSIVQCTRSAGFQTA